MKLITAIVNKEDSRVVCNELVKHKFYVTRLATTGGFLMAGNMTLLICTEDERVDACIGIISQFCKQRTEIVPGTATMLWHRERHADGSHRRRGHRHRHQRRAF